jgi:hypothetical protein
MSFSRWRHRSWKIPWVVGFGAGNVMMTPLHIHQVLRAVARIQHPVSSRWSVSNDLSVPLLGLTDMCGGILLMLVVILLWSRHHGASYLSRRTTRVPCWDIFSLRQFFFIFVFSVVIIWPDSTSWLMKPGIKYIHYPKKISLSFVNFLSEE